MNLFSVFQQFPDQAACIRHLEAVRWGEEPQCPFCESPRVARKAERELVGRWNCHAEPPAGYGGVGWSGGNPHDYDRESGRPDVDVVRAASERAW